jgi:hypothetical protein
MDAVSVPSINRDRMNELRSYFSPLGTEYVLKHGNNVIQDYTKDAIIPNSEKLRILLSLVHVNALNISISVEELIYKALTVVLWDLYPLLTVINEKVKCAAFLHPRFDEQNHRRLFLEEDLLKIAEESTNHERFDALDFIRSRYFNIHPDHRKKADELFNATQVDEHKGIAVAPTFTDDTQNVHNTTISKGIEQALLDLSYDPIPHRLLADNNRRFQTISDVMDEILKLITGKARQKINHSLERIYTDHSEFKYRLRLRDVLQRVWNRTRNFTPTEQAELHKRLVEELTDATSMCATGLLGRLLNILSGQDINKGGLDLITIGWGDEIYSAYRARLEKALKELPSETYSVVLCDLPDVGEKDPENTAWHHIENLSASVYMEMLKEYRPLFEQETVPNLPILTLDRHGKNKQLKEETSFNLCFQQAIDKFIGVVK